MQKTYTRINWENYPSENTPLNESNLNRVDYAVDEIDDRVITLNTDKADVTTVSSLIKDISVDDATGVITVTKENGTTATIQTTLNKIAVNFAYDYNSQSLLLTLNDGTVATISLATLIQNNEFANTDTITLSVDGTGTVKAQIVDHSITAAQLQTNYLADIQLSEAHADAYQQAAESFSLDSEAWAKGTRSGVNVTAGMDGYNDNSRYYSMRSEAWAKGTFNGVPVASTDETYEHNAYYYAEISSNLRDATQSIKNDAADLLQTVTDRLTGLNMSVNYVDGCLYYDMNSGIVLTIDNATGDLLYEVN